VTNKEGETVIPENALTDLAVDVWKLTRLCERVIDKLDAGDKLRYASQLRYLQTRLSSQLADSGLSVVSLDGHPCEEGMAATVLNLDEFTPEEVLVVAQTVEPVVMGREGLRKQGTVLARRAAV